MPKRCKRCICGVLAGSNSQKSCKMCQRMFYKKVSTKQGRSTKVCPNCCSRSASNNTKVCQKCKHVFLSKKKKSKESDDFDDYLEMLSMMISDISGETKGISV